MGCPNHGGLVNPLGSTGFCRSGPFLKEFNMPKTKQVDNKYRVVQALAAALARNFDQFDLYCAGTEGFVSSYQERGGNLVILFHGDEGDRELVLRPIHWRKPIRGDVIRDGR